MPSVAETIITLLNAQIARANATTGQEDTTVTDAITSLIDGFDTSAIPDLTDVVEWYKSSVNNAMAYIKSLDGYVHHIICTDIHYDTNFKHSAPIINSLMGTGKFDKFLLLGDCTDTNSPTEFQNFVNDGWGEHNGSIIFCLGNHDAFQTVTGHPENSDFYDAFLSDASYADGAEESLHYVYTDAKNKIKYVVLNTEGISTSDPQLDTIRDAVADSGWTVFVLGHRNLNVGENWSQQIAEGTTNAIVSAMLSGNANVGGYICGHQHIDVLSEIGDGKAYQMTLLNDRKETTNYYDGLSVTARNGGTPQEQAITIMSVNPTTKNVKFYRIGAYKTKQAWEYNYASSGQDVVAVTNHSISGVYDGVRTNNHVTSIANGAEYNAVISGDSGKVASGIQVTMGGTDITADVVADNEISIPSVTDDVEIKAYGHKASGNILVYEHVGNGVLDSFSYETNHVSFTGGNAYRLLFVNGVKQGDVYEVYFVADNQSATGGVSVYEASQIDANGTGSIGTQVVKPNSGGKNCRRLLSPGSSCKAYVLYVYTPGVLWVKRMQKNTGELFNSDCAVFTHGDATCQWNTDGSITVGGTVETSVTSPTNYVSVVIDDIITNGVYRVIATADTVGHIRGAALSEDNGVDDTTLNGTGYNPMNSARKTVDINGTFTAFWGTLCGRRRYRFILTPGATYNVSVKLEES